MSEGAPPPRRIGPFLLGEELGRGGMGAVFAATHEQTGARRAVKLILGGGVAGPGALDDLLRFRREAQLLSRLNHPHLVRVREAELERPPFYVAFDLLPGGSLRDRLRREGRLPLEEAIELGIKLGGALAHAHAHQVLHRDIKPGNVLYDEDGEPRLGDFGLSRRTTSLSEELTTTGVLLGTPSYASPEQVRDSKRVDERSDVYGLGALLYAVIGGGPPFRGGSIGETLRMVCEEEPLPLRRLRPEVPAALEAAVHRALAKDPGARPQSAAAFVAELEALRAGAPEQPARAARRALPAALGLAALALAVGAALLAWTRSRGLEGAPGPGLAARDPGPASSAGVAPAGEGGEDSPPPAPEGPPRYALQSGQESTWALTISTPAAPRLSWTWLLRQRVLGERDGAADLLVEGLGLRGWIDWGGQPSRIPSFDSDLSDAAMTLTQGVLRALRAAAGWRCRVLLRLQDGVALEAREEQSVGRALASCREEEALMGAELRVALGLLESALQPAGWRALLQGVAGLAPARDPRPGGASFQGGQLAWAVLETTLSTEQGEAPVVVRLEQVPLRAVPNPASDGLKGLLQPEFALNKDEPWRRVPTLRLANGLQSTFDLAGRTWLLWPDYEFPRQGELVQVAQEPAALRLTPWGPIVAVLEPGTLLGGHDQLGGWTRVSHLGAMAWAPSAALAPGRGRAVRIHNSQAYAYPTRERVASTAWCVLPRGSVAVVRDEDRSDPRKPKLGVDCLDGVGWIVEADTTPLGPAAANQGR